MIDYPDKFTIDQIEEEITVLNKIKEGLKHIEEDKVFTTTQVKQKLKKWLK